MLGKNFAVFGIYASQSDADIAVNRLKLTGFRDTDVSGLFPETAGTKDLALEKNTKAPEGATVGAACGAVAGGILGWLVGAGTLTIPELAPFVAAGPLLSLLSGIGAGGALGGLTGAIVGLGTPEYVAKRFEGRIRRGGILLSVHCDDSNWVRIARSVLDQTAAQGVSSAHEAKADYASGERPRSRAVSSSGARVS
jgi:hypothetical protein